MLFIRSQWRLWLRVTTETLPLVSFTQQPVDCDKYHDAFIIDEHTRQM